MDEEIVGDIGELIKNFVLATSKRTGYSAALTGFDIIIYAAVFVAGLVLTIRLFQVWQQAGKLQSQVFPGLLLILAAMLEITILLANELMILVSNDMIRLNFWLMIPQVLIFLLVSKFVINKIVIVPITRSSQIRLLHLLLNISVLSGMILLGVIFVTASQSQAIPFIMGISVLNLVIFVIIIRIIWRESKENSSTIQRLRLKMLSYGYSVFLFRILLALPQLILIDSASPFFILLYGFRLVDIVMVFTAMTCFYWSYFTPKWQRQLENMNINPFIINSKEISQISLNFSN